MSEINLELREGTSTLSIEAKGRGAWWSSLSLAVTASAMALALFMTFVVAPREATMGDLQRIFYFHVASSWVGYLALLVTFAASILYLRQGARRWDIVAVSSTEIGLLFITQGILSGSIWARPAWGTWWTWDPRLTTSAVLWVMYAAYLLLRQAVAEESRRARLSAVYGVIAFITVPLNFVAIRWWRAMHPKVLGRTGSGLTSTMQVVLFVCVAAFTILYVTLLSQRMRLGHLEEDVHQLHIP
jgi:heme exporter protein C